MSANLDLVRSIWADWERGDFNRADWADPGIEYVWVDGPDPGSWTGLAAMTKHSREFMSAWEDFRFEADQYRELGDGCVLVLYHRTGRGKASGLEIERTRAEGAGVFGIRDGRVTRAAFYWDRARAFADLGLAPETCSPPSSENAELVRRCMEAYRAGGFDAIRSFLQPEFEMDELPGSPKSGTYRGTQAAFDSMLDWQSAFEDFDAEATEYIDAGEQVIVAVDERGKMRAGGVELRETFYLLFTLREDMIVRMQWFADRSDAMHAAGIASETEAP